jgi:hypothetical protein
MAKVRKFNIDVPAAQAVGEGRDTTSGRDVPARNAVPDLPRQVVDSVSASAPVQIRSRRENRGPGNPRQRRYRQKTYSLLQEDINRIEDLVANIRSAGLYDRGRSDIVRAGVALLRSLPIEEQIKALQAVENLRET